MQRSFGIANSTSLWPRPRPPLAVCGQRQSRSGVSDESGSKNPATEERMQKTLAKRDCKHRRQIMQEKKPVPAPFSLSTWASTSPREEQENYGPRGQQILQRETISGLLVRNSPGLQAQRVAPQRVARPRRRHAPASGEAGAALLVPAEAAPAHHRHLLEVSRRGAADALAGLLAAAALVIQDAQPVGVAAGGRRR